MKTVLAASLMAATLAIPAEASCPTAEDLAEGVVLVQNAPIFVRTDVERQPTGFKEVRLIRDGDRRAQVQLSTFDHAIARSMTSDGLSETVFTYSDAVTRLDGLAQAGEVRFDVVASRRPAGGPAQRTSGQLIYRFEGAGETRIMSCTYATWQVRELRADETGAISSRLLTYAPELRLVLAERALSGPGVSYAYSWIGTSAEVAR